MQERIKKNASKYHMIRFVDRKRLTRLIRQTNSRIKKKEKEQSSQTAEKELNKLEKKRDELLDDLTYVM